MSARGDGAESAGGGAAGADLLPLAVMNTSPVSESSVALTASRVAHPLPSRLAAPSPLLFDHDRSCPQPSPNPSEAKS